MVNCGVTSMGFISRFKHLGATELPKFSGTRVMMLPVIIGDLNSLPEFISQYKETMNNMFSMCNMKHLGKVGYLTVDEKLVEPSKTHRREGLHVDGVYNGRAGGWGGGNGGGWGSVGNGMLTVASHVGCKAYSGLFNGWPGNDGECEHLQEQCKDGTLFKENNVYWVDGLCVHESIPQKKTINRQFIRLSMPSDAPWFEGYTANPLGIIPTGEILPKRKFMDT